MKTLMRGLLVGLGFGLLLVLPGCGYHGGYYSGYVVPAFDVHLSHFSGRHGHHPGHFSGHLRGRVSGHHR